MIIRMIIAFFILFVVSFNAVAGEHSYTCKIMHVYGLDTDGSLVSSNLENQYKGSEFLVSRVTGEIIGEVVPTLLSRSTKVMIKDSKESSFKTVADFGYQPQLAGTNGFVPKEEKTFFAISMNGAEFITGLYE
ncbi:MAG: hypothetical protein ACUZ8N_01895 [Candidatus Scalindua sp.]